MKMPSDQHRLEFMLDDKFECIIPKKVSKKFLQVVSYVMLTALSEMTGAGFYYLLFSAD